MRRELAIVLETYNNNIAKVQLQRSSSCDGCKICSTGKPIILRAINNINASNGDNVIIEVEELKKSTNFFVYIIPLICLIIGYFVGNYISKIANINHDLGPVISFVFFFVYIFFGILKLKKNNNKVIANIIAKNKL
ncbi:SoxR reducing system RseC family protein [Brachyspira pilosicoli]|uniref:SoxR reducing system RseC family protein n=1 Tax=Brachyspira pilosicoli TaxID=52584 RepID=UPI003003DB7E